jgi:hypothetical protein
MPGINSNDFAGALFTLKGTGKAERDFSLSLYLLHPEKLLNEIPQGFLLNGKACNFFARE